MHVFLKHAQISIFYAAKVLCKKIIFDLIALIGENEEQVSVLRALEYILPAANKC